MKIKISATDAARNLGDCLARVKHTGDSFVLTKNNRAVAVLGPVPGSGGAMLDRVLSAMREVVADSDFSADLEHVNRSDEILENQWR